MARGAPAPRLTPIAQGIEHRFPKPAMMVRIRLGVQQKKEDRIDPPFLFYLYKLVPRRTGNPTRTVDTQSLDHLTCSTSRFDIDI